MTDWLDIRPGFVAVICASLYFGQVRLTAAFLLAATLHECAHILTALMLGAGIQTLTLSWFGAKLTLRGTTNYLFDILLCLSGPVINFLLAFRTDDALFAGSNFLLAVLNLMPIRGLDGGNAFYAVLAWATGPLLAEKVCLICSVMWALATTIGGGMVLFVGGAPWLLVVGLWLLRVTLGKAEK